jgi:hypothetical protein
MPRATALRSDSPTKRNTRIGSCRGRDSVTNIGVERGGRILHGFNRFAKRFVARAAARTSPCGIDGGGREVPGIFRGSSSHVLSIIEAAGWPIWLIIVTSVIALAIIGERFWSLRTALVAPRDVLPADDPRVPGQGRDARTSSTACRAARSSGASSPRR